MSSSGKGFRFNEGDWTCPECNNVNFARRSQCNRCGAERKYETKKIKKGGVEIGKMAAEKSRGLFSADDWMCKTCGNVNWARRSDCNMCNTPKINVQEERTGLGGGFNERDGVEYKAKEDSDGEFDEFGRKKKKYRGKPATGAIITERETALSEEEEESGDDGDVSKYDLDADDDEDDDEDGDTAKYDLDASDNEDNKKSDRSSRSRSRSRSLSSSSSDRRSSRSRSNSRSRRRRRSRSSSSSGGSNHGRSRHARKRREKRGSRSRSRSPRHRSKRSSSRERRHHRR